jgi:hypothetical protein
VTGAVPGFIQGNEDVALDIAALRFLRAEAASLAKTAAHARTEELFEKTAEAGAAEFKFLGAVAGGAATTKGLTATKPAVAGRGTELRARFPVGTEFIVFLALVLVGQNLVGLVDLLEPFLGFFLVLGDVRMIFAGQLAEGFLDVGIARGAGNAERFVIVFVFNGHRLATGYRLDEMSSTVRKMMRTCR